MSAYLEKIEDAIYNIQHNKENVSYHLGIVRKMLNLEFKCNCVELNLVKNTAKGYFFGAHVFPTEKELYKINDNVMRVGENIKFEKCSEFVIELDSKLVYDIGATPREIVAVLLHEIGHKAFNTNAQVRSKTLFVLNITKFIPSAALVFKVFSPIKFMLSTLVLSCFESSFNNLSSIKNEIEADKFVIANGYAIELNSILTKLTSNSSKIIVMSRHAEQEEKAIMDWTITNALSFSIRRASIISDIQRQLKGEPSPYIKRLLERQLKEIKKTQGSFSIKTLKSEEIEEVKNESMRAFFETHSRGYSYLEIDELEVEIERVTTHEDKLYLISRIHKDIRQAEDSLLAISNGTAKKSFKKSDVPAIKDYIKKLNDLLKKVKAIKIKEENYDRTVINITYPKGYEG